MRLRLLGGALVVLLAVAAVPASASATGVGGPDPDPSGARANDATLVRATHAAVVTPPDWVPYVGSYPVGCTRGNPSPWGVCDHHHSYIGAIDLHVPVGTVLRAAGGGTVVKVVDTCAVGDTGCEGGGGNWVGILHAGGRVSRYMHLDTVAVTEDDRITRGTVIGTAGITGNAVVSHLHYDEQVPLWTRAEMGEMFACVEGTFRRYPRDLGYASWEAVPYGTVIRSDGHACAGTVFYDVAPGSPFEASIAWLADTGVTEGYGDGTFGATDVVTRQASAAWFHRLAGSPGGPFPDPGFVDVPPDHPFATSIRWMVTTGRSFGFSDGTYRPVECVTRQALAAFLHREAGAPSGPFPDPGFVDVPPDHLFASEIAWLAASGITTGYHDGAFRPDECVTRQTAAAFLFRSQS
jgi:hypothetical protein